MANRKFTVSGPFPAYGVQIGESVVLDADDVLVQANVTAGLIRLAVDQPKTIRITCPACIGQNVKKPASYADTEEMVAHYAEKHPALVIPEWKEEVS